MVVPEIDVEALAAALEGNPLVDLVTDIVTPRQNERRPEIEAEAALVADTPVPVTAGAGQNRAS
ncbi:hypothetical protein ABZ400_02830 [Streptomyces sp. NPDC005897]|uniref:hypothetical protein n=1 Tax=Streptomyces sp. NPDC005897 TaxID=3157081 RepID=UPI0033DDB863